LCHGGRDLYRSGSTRQEGYWPDYYAARGVTREEIGVLCAARIAPLVRVNLETMYEDVLGVMTKGLKGVCLPKLDNAHQVRQLSDVLSYAEGKAGLPHGAVDIVAIPETAAGLCGVQQLAVASPRVKSVMNDMNDRPSEEVVFQVTRRSPQASFQRRRALCSAASTWQPPALWTSR